MRSNLSSLFSTAGLGLLLFFVSSSVLPTVALAQEGAEEPAAAEAADEPAAAEANAEAEAPAPAAKAANRGGPVIDEWDDQHSIYRYEKPFISWWKMLLVGLAFLFWIRVGDWVNRDTHEYDLEAAKWNPMAVVPGVIAGAMLLLIPIFAGSYSLLAISCLAPMIAYAVIHNKAVEEHQRVFTGDWFRHAMADAASSVGIKVKTERVPEYQKGAPVDLIAKGGDERTNHANLITARQSPGFVLVKDFIADMAGRRSEKALLDYTSETVAIRQYIDGVWQNDEPKDRETGDVMLAVIKQLANLKPAERRAKQSGEFAAEYKGIKYVCPLTCAGTKTGERAMLTVTGGATQKMRTFTDLGMRDKLSGQWSELMASDVGLLVVSAMPEGGLTTTMNVSLSETDRLMRDFFAIEDEHHLEETFENIEVFTYDSKKGESPATLMPKLIRKYPNVYVVRDFVDTESAKILLDQVKDEKLVMTTMPARDASEALLRMLQKKVPQRDLAETITAVLNARLIRLLCPDCKVSYEPKPELLKKLGIPAGKVTELFRVPNEEEADKPCKKCQGVGYLGRTALFELLIADDGVREVLLKAPKPETLRKAARAAGMRTHQEEGILLIAKGATSLQELQRILKT